MKILLLIIVGICLPLFTFGQGNLQFSKAKYIKFNKTFQANGTEYQFFDSLVTVPPGKIWKIESSGTTCVDNTTTSYPNSRLDGVVIASAQPGRATVNFPIWLPEGTYKFGISTIPLSGPEQILAYFSILEFNVVQ